MKIPIQIILVSFAITITVYGIEKMSETATMILPSWFVISLIAFVTCLISFSLGFLLKHVLNSNWHPISFASIFIIILVASYCIVEYKPMLKIVVPDNFAGEVKLFVSNSDLENYEVILNNFGIGYITNRDIEKGFYPKILQGRNNITKQVKEYSRGVWTTTSTNNYFFKYLSFEIPGDSNKFGGSIQNLLDSGAIDTTRLPKRY